jgi:hypothetical protein
VSDLPEPAPIREFGRIDSGQFQEIRALQKPAIFRGLASDWPAVRAALQGDEEIIAYLKRFPGSRPAAIVGPPEIKGRFFYNDDVTALNFQRGVTDLAPFLDRLMRDRDEAAPIAMAVQSEPIAQLLPGFEAENSIEILHREVPPRAWIGNRIQVAPHYDLQENIGIVVAGRRRFTVFPPDQLPNLYPGPFELTPAGTPISMVDPHHPDLERYPRFAEAMKTAEWAELGPGDAIYIPYHWWHGVDSLDPVNLFINYWWSDAPAGAGGPYDALMYAFFALKLLPPEQREVWRMVFDHYVFCVDGDPGEHLPEHARGILGPATPTLLKRMRMTIKKIAEGL